ncbi:ABC transporter transmembrane domain-containing protein [Fructilactobacillus frigidiflavus]|uniref:ABC transporter transmembrane domain-containing protein n=1 Tax=Fructilactobacillus frigidiflavus TaxID=3242688 RepID=UPI00375803DC
MKFTKKEIIKLSLGSIFLITASISESAIPFLIGKLIDCIGHTSSYIFIGLLLFGLMLISLFNNRIGKNIINLTVVDIISNTRNTIIDIWEDATWDRLKNEKPGEFISLINDDLDNIQDFTTYDIPILLTQIICFFVAITQIFIISKSLTLILIFIYFFYLVPFRGLIKKQYNSQNELRKTKIDLKLTTSDLIENQEKLYQISYKTFILNKFIILYKKMNKMILLTEILKNNSKILPRTIDSLGPAVVILYGGFLQMNGLITMGEFVTIFAYLSMFSAPFKNSMNIITAAQEAMVSINKIQEYKKTNIKKINKIKNDYLKRIDNSEYVILKGPSGIGKSTILNSIFFNSDENKIIMYVPQDVIVFPGTIRENLLRNDLNSGKFDELLYFLPELNHVISSNGGLSTGQKMLLNVIRQSVFNADIILLDEIGANIDDNLKQVLNDYFMKFFNNKTIIEITHLSNPIVNDREITREIEVNND